MRAQITVSVLNRESGAWESIGTGRTVAGVIHRRYGRRSTYQPDSGVPGYGLLLSPCSTGGWNVDGRVSWETVRSNETTEEGTR